MILLSNGGCNIQASGHDPDALLIGTVDGLVALQRDGVWREAFRALRGCSISALTRAADGSLYAATHGVGVARSRDDGRTWTWINDGLTSLDLWSARAGRLCGRDVVLVGALPARLFINDDNGDSWRELTGLQAAPSVKKWTFPPPPHAGHVKDITIDGDRLFVGIEIGALLRSNDGGETFVELGPDPDPIECDVHRVLVHSARPGRLIVANGIVGLCSSDDDGATWRPNALPPGANYPDAMALDPENPDLVVLTAGQGWPVHWYRAGRARGQILRSRDGGVTWERLLGGLPNGQRALFGAITASRANGALALYAVDSDGQVFESRNDGDSWEIIADVPPVSKGEFYRGLAKDRPQGLYIEDIRAGKAATQRWAALP